MKLKSFFLAFLTIAILFMFFIPEETKAQSTTVGTFKQIDPQHVVWTVASASFDSAATIWSRGFYLEPGSATFDAQGTINMGTVTGEGGTYSTVLLLYASFDDGTNYELCDSLGTVTATTTTKISVDLDDFDQAPQYKIKATNGGEQNSFKLGLWRE